jgi:hypothetical protein
MSKGINAKLEPFFLKLFPSLIYVQFFHRIHQKNSCMEYSATLVVRFNGFIS